MVYGMKDTLLAAIEQGFEVVYFDCHHKQWKPFTSETEVLDCSSYYINKKPSSSETSSSSSAGVAPEETTTPWILSTAIHATPEPFPEPWRPAES